MLQLKQQILTAHLTSHGLKLCYMHDVIWQMAAVFHSTLSESETADEESLHLNPSDAMLTFEKPQVIYYNSFLSY